jgi:hypothetical protein
MSRTATAWIGCVGLALALAVASPATAAQSGERDTSSGSEKGTEGPEQSKAKVAPFVEAKGGKGSTSPVKVYTNEDLERLAGSEPAAATEAPASAADAKKAESGAEPVDAKEAESGAEPPDAVDTQEKKSALDELFEQQAARKEHEEKVAEAEKRVAAAKERIKDLEKRALEIKNPYLPRPKAPEEGAEEWERSNGPQRLKQTNDQLQAARDELAEAERELAELRSSAP